MTRKTVRARGVRTSTTLELEFWAYINAIARWRGVPASYVVESILAEEPPGDSHASTLRVYCLQHALRHSAQMRQAA